MNAARQVALALRTLVRNPLRTLFMLLGVTVGVASLTALTMVSEATRQETMRQFKRMMGNVDTVTVRPGKSATRGMPSLTTVDPSLKFEDATAIGAEVRAVARVAPVQNAFEIDVKYREKSGSPSIYGVPTGWIDMRGDELTMGSDFTDEDVGGLARVAILGDEVRRNLFGDEDPVGQVIRIADVPFQVKGALASRGTGPGGGSLDNLIYIPVTTASKRLFNRDYLTMLVVQLRDPLQTSEAVAQIDALLRERHGIAPGTEADFNITTPAANLALVQQVGSTLSSVMVGIAVVAMLIGGAVIMSLMLIAVSERRREIGVRRAVGASRRDILSQFLIEAAAVSGLGGLLGVAIGVGAGLVATSMRQLPPVIVWDVVALSVAVSVVIGVVFGLQPAWRAANVDPIDALRA